MAIALRRSPKGCIHHANRGSQYCSHDYQKVLRKHGLMDDLFRQAGFRSVATMRTKVPFRLPQTATYLTFIRDSAGPILKILAPLDETARAVAWGDIAAQLEVYQTEDGWIGPNTLLLTAGQK